MTSERRLREDGPRGPGGPPGRRNRPPVPVRMDRPGEDALFVFDCAGDAASCGIAYRWVVRSVVAVLHGLPPAGRVVLRSGTIVPSLRLAHLVALDPFRPARFVVALAAPRNFLSAAALHWSRLAPRSAVVAGTFEPGGLDQAALDVRAIVADGASFLPRGLDDDGAEALLRATSLQAHRVESFVLFGLACGALRTADALREARRVDAES